MLQRMLLRRSLARAGRAREGGAGGYARLLYTGSSVSPERKLLRRAALIVALLALVMLVFWLERGNLRDAADGHVSFIDVVYFTMVTVTTVGYGDIIPVGERARLLDALLVTPIRIFVWFIFLGTAYEFVFQRILEDLRMNALRDSLQDHVIVCGYGYSWRWSVTAACADSGMYPRSASAKATWCSRSRRAAGARPRPFAGGAAMVAAGWPPSCVPPGAVAWMVW